MDAGRDFSRYRVVEHLADGREVVVRAVTPADRDALLAGFEHLSPDSVYSRFLGARRVLGAAELDFFVSPDFDHHVAIGAEIAANDGVMTPVGVARYVRGNDPVAAEFAVAVADAFHGLGIGTLLLRHLVLIAQAHGLARLEGIVLASNHDMLDVVTHLAEHAGIMHHERAEDGTVSVTLDL